MNLVKRPAVLTGLFILVLLSLVFLRTHGWRVPVSVSDSVLSLTAARRNPRGHGVRNA